jgi:hypothetical protein
MGPQQGPRQGPGIDIVSALMKEDPEVLARRLQGMYPEVDPTPFATAVPPQEVVADAPPKPDEVDWEGVLTGLQDFPGFQPPSQMPGMRGFVSPGAPPAQMMQKMSPGPRPQFQGIGDILGRFRNG